MRIPAKLVCDRCGRQFKRSSVKVTTDDGVERYIHGVAAITSGRYLAHKTDLCNECVKSFLEWLGAEHAKKETEGATAVPLTMPDGSVTSVVTVSHEPSDPDMEVSDEY